MCWRDDYTLNMNETLVGGALPAYLEPLAFANEYVEHVSAAEVSEDELAQWQAKWYAKTATIPDINDTRARIKLPLPEDAETEASPLRDLRVDLDVLWYTQAGHAFEGSLFERVSPAGHMPVLRLLVPSSFADQSAGVGQSEPVEYSIEYHHTYNIAIDHLILTFDLWGTDPQTGEPAGERHVVKLRSFELLGFDDSHIKSREVDAPYFVITSHTIEALGPDKRE